MKRLLYIDTVPKSAWYANLRHALSQTEWNNIRTQVYRRAFHQCEVCGGKGPMHPVEAHERWLFDAQSQMQILAAIESLCPACHESTHFGLAQMKGRAEHAARHLMTVNVWNEIQVVSHVKKATKEFNRLCSVNSWRLDISLLDQIASIKEPETNEIMGRHEQLAKTKSTEFWKSVVIQHAKRLIPD